MAETHELSQRKNTIGYEAAMRTLTFIGFDMRDSRFSDLGIPAIWTAYLAEFDRLFVLEQQRYAEERAEEKRITIGQMMKELAQRREEDSRIDTELAEIGARIFASLDLDAITYTTADELAKLYLGGGS